MSHDHSHDGHHHGHSHAHGVSESNENRALIAAVITGTVMIAEVIGGIVTGSLALLADAAHMLADCAALLLAWWAFRLSRRPADANRTYGYDRFQIVAAFANGITLALLTLWIVVEAIERTAEPQAIDGLPMTIVAVIGLIANLIAFAVLHGGDRQNLNMRGALLHVAGDILGSLAAIIAGVVIMLTGWLPIDVILSLVIAVLLARAAWSLIRDAGRILLEAAPDGFDSDAARSDLAEAIADVAEVRHMHVWSITEGRCMATMHLVIVDGADACEAMDAVKARMAERHGVGHVTIEIVTQ
jgi:cobalt-zinc-cadmium efflux system protein